MDLSNIAGYDEAVARVNRYKSARTKHLEMLSSFVSGTQYSGRPDWFSESVPLWERAPCIVYPITKAAIDSNADLLLGELTFPSICVPHSNDILVDDGLSEDESELVNRWLVELEQYTKLRTVCRELFKSAQGCGSACAIVGIRSGRVVIDTVKAAWCTPTLDNDGNTVALVIEYAFLDLREQADGSKVVVPMLYRRTVDAFEDITYKPTQLLDVKPVWVVHSKIMHGLGFCPVRFYAHHKGCSTVAEIDGHAIHEHVLDEITALDFTLSQRHRASLYAGDPQWTEVGVEPGFNPTGGGRLAHATPATFAGGLPSASNLVVGHYVTPGPAKVRKKSPGVVWQYENPQTRVELHTLPGEALSAIDNHAKDLKKKIAESLGVVFIDPENIPRGGEMSGKAMAAVKSRQLDQCDTNRADFGDECLRPLVELIFRIVVSRPEGLKIPGVAKVKPLLRKLLDRGLMLRLDWGPYSRPDGAEELALIQAASLALESGLATVRSAVMMTKEVLGVDDVDEHVELLEAQAKEREAKALTKAEHAEVGSAQTASTEHPSAKAAMPEGSAATAKASEEAEQ